MDLNLVVLAGRLAAPAELRRFESGSSLLRLLVTIRTASPRRRVDVVPVSLWNPPNGLAAAPPERGEGVWVAGAIQRRFWESPDGRRSRLEIVAREVQRFDPDADGDGESAGNEESGGSVGSGGEEGDRKLGSATGTPADPVGNSSSHWPAH